MLQIGVHGFQSLLLADQQNRTRLAAGGIDEDWESQDDAIRAACKFWLSTAMEIIRVVDRVDCPDSLSELGMFRDCYREMASIVAYASD